MNGRIVKRGILLFWALWLTLVLLTNLFGLGKAMGLIDPRWAFASYNFELVRKTVGTFSAMVPMAGFLFVAVIAWEGLAAWYFWQASLSYTGANSRAVWTAFGVSLALWSVFLITGELFIQYELEAVHLRIFTAQMTSLLAIHLLPDSSSIN